MDRAFRIDPMFSDHMILQRDVPTPIWGTGRDGDSVGIECRGERAETVVSDGRWSVELPPMPAGSPCELTVRSGGDQLVLHDVLFGDVWLAGGQSNMEWPLRDAKGADGELPNAVFERIRHYQVPRVEYDDGSLPEPSAGWQVCDPVHAPAFSAVAYYFARAVHLSTGVPIGIVNCSWGGTSASCWVEERRLRRRPELGVYLTEWREKLKDFDWDSFAEERKAYDASVAQGIYPWPPPLSPRSFLRPNGLYHTMLRKAAPYALKGFLYYQGESDADKPLLYDTLLTELIDNWRTDWRNADLPFLIVQLPVYGCDGNEDGEDWALLRESQQIVGEKVPNTHLVPILEHGEKDDIHPRDKKPVGERLALTALDRVYGMNADSFGPELAEMQVGDGQAILRFAHAGGGLAVRGHGPLKGFAVAGTDGVYSEAEAEIAGRDTVVVRSPDVGHPAFVRYGWANYSEANLVNGDGLSAAPFRYPRPKERL